MDIVLSSGFLAFARHIGLLAALEEARIPVTGLCGTSSGALVGALWSSGMRSSDLLERFARSRPLCWMGLSRRPWRGLFSMQRVVDTLRDWGVGETFADLSYPFAVGVCDAQGRHRLLSQGPLRPAVAASCAMPWVFEPVCIGQNRFRDGGMADRTGLDAWVRMRGAAPKTLLHLVQRSHGAKDSPTAQVGLLVVNSRRSGATFWNLGNVRQQAQETQRLTRVVLGRPELEPDAQGRSPDWEDQ